MPPGKPDGILKVFVCPGFLQQARAARPFVFGAEHGDRDFGRIGISHDAVLVEIVGGLLDLDIAASDATIGFSMPLAFISFFTSTMFLANTIGGVTMVCQ